MNAIRIRTQVGQNRELILRNLPLSEGKKVEVIIRDDNSTVELITNDRFPLRGKSIQFDKPFDPATDDSNWEVNR